MHKDSSSSKGSQCGECGEHATHRECRACGTSAWLIDCGHQQQPRPIAAGRADGSDLSHDYCESCATALASALSRTPSHCESGRITSDCCESKDEGDALHAVLWLPPEHRDTARAAGSARNLACELYLCSDCLSTLGEGEDAQWFLEAQAMITEDAGSCWWPTHRISAQGDVTVVCLAPNAAGAGLAHSLVEWLNRDYAYWERDAEGTWTGGGEPLNGSVTDLTEVC